MPDLNPNKMALTSEELKQIACTAIDSAADELNGISKKIWNRPELKFEEHFASSLLADFLDKHNFDVTRKFVLDTGFRADYGEVNDKPLVAVMCEYDALPQIGHACGHNLVAEAGVGAGLGIKAAIDAAKVKGQNLGRVTVFGTPGEEGGGGKVKIIREGAFSKPPVACALMSNPWSVDIAAPTGFICRELVKVTYKGVASHAAGSPWKGINALDAAVMAYNSISVLRQQMKPTWRIHGVITNGGTRPNVITELSELEFYVRAPTIGELKELREKADSCFQSAAICTGCEVELEWNDRPYKNMIQNATAVSLYEQNARDLGLTFQDDELVSGVAHVGSTDMGNVSHVVPSIHPAFHIGGGAANHTRDFTALAGAEAAQPYTLTQAKALAMTAIDVLCQPELATKMADELKHDLKGENGSV